MARRRMLSTRISLSKKINAVSDQAALLYTWIIPHLDELGLMEADPEIIRAQVVPLRSNYSSVVINRCLQELENEGAIIRYEAGDSSYLHYPDFFNHQTLKKDRTPRSEYPLPEWIKVEIDSNGIPNITMDSSVFQRKAKEKKREDKRSDVKNGIQENPKENEFKLTPAIKAWEEYTQSTISSMDTHKLRRLSSWVDEEVKKAGLQKRLDLPGPEVIAIAIRENLSTVNYPLDDPISYLGGIVRNEVKEMIRLELENEKR